MCNLVAKLFLVAVMLLTLGCGSNPKKDPGQAVFVMNSSLPLMKKPMYAKGCTLGVATITTDKFTVVSSGPRGSEASEVEMPTVTSAALQTIADAASQSTGCTLKPVNMDLQRANKQFKAQVSGRSSASVSHPFFYDELRHIAKSADVDLLVMTFPAYYSESTKSEKAMGYGAVAFGLLGAAVAGLATQNTEHTLPQHLFRQTMIKTLQFHATTGMVVFDTAADGLIDKAFSHRRWTLDEGDYDNLDNALKQGKISKSTDKEIFEVLLDKKIQEAKGLMQDARKI